MPAGDAHNTRCSVTLGILGISVIEGREPTASAHLGIEDTRQSLLDKVGKETNLFLISEPTEVFTVGIP